MPPTFAACDYPAPLLTRSHFTVRQQKLAQQMPAWRDYVRSLETLVARVHTRTGFHGEVDRYAMHDVHFMECRTSPIVQARTPACISTDTMRDFVFHVTLEGVIETTTARPSRRSTVQFMPGIVAVDMNQCMRMERPRAARVMAFFLSRAQVEAVIPDAETIHGQVIPYHSPLTRLVFAQLQNLSTSLPTRSDADAEQAIRQCATLIVAAFGKQVRLAEQARAAARAVMLERVQDYIRANLAQRDLTPERLQQLFRLARPTLYRLFEPEGGLVSYIRHQRLRLAAQELVAYPQLGVTEIAYGLNFNSGSDFTRAFRRTYGMSPQEMRAQAPSFCEAQGFGGRG